MESDIGKFQIVLFKEFTVYFHPVIIGGVKPQQLFDKFKVCS